MKLGKLKTYYEKKLAESYKDEKEFKKTLNEFKVQVLENKNLLKVYSLYDELSKPQGLNEQDAHEFLKEGITLIKSILPKTKLPKVIIEGKENDYQKLDDLVYVTNRTIYLNDRLSNKKDIVKTLTCSKSEIKESVNIPISSMVKVGNQILKNYLDNLSEETKKEFLEIVSEDTKTLETKFKNLKNETLQKLSVLENEEKDSETLKTLQETTNKIKNETFSQLTYLKMKKLNETI